MLNGPPHEDSSAYDLRLNKRISIFFASGASDPDAEIPVVIGGGRLLASSIALQEKDRRHNHGGTESCQDSHAKKRPARDRASGGLTSAVQSFAHAFALF